MSEQDTIIEFAGDKWRVVGVGAEVDGKVYVHLSSTTRFRQQRNGRNPVQMCDWIDRALLTGKQEEDPECSNYLEPFPPCSSWG